jgi:hypothetical protein
MYQKTNYSGFVNAVPSLAILAIPVSEEMLERNGIEEKVRKEHGKQGVYISK